MKIIDYKVVLPALFKYDLDGNEKVMFCYIDHVNKEVIIPDCPEGVNADEFSKLAYEHVMNTRHFVNIPQIPKSGFNKLSD